MAILKTKLAVQFCRRDSGKSRGLQGANRHQIATIAECLKASAVSIGGGGSAVGIILVGEVRRMVDGGGRRCGVESLFVLNHFIPKRWAAW
jgi:hypothetical protein